MCENNILVTMEKTEKFSRFFFSRRTRANAGMSFRFFFLFVCYTRTVSD